MHLGLVGLLRFYYVRAELRTAHELGEQILSLAQSVQDPLLLMRAHQVLADTLCFLGELSQAQKHLEQSFALYDPQQSHSHRFFDIDPIVGSLIFASWFLWLLGYPDQALKSSHEALTRAHEMSHPFSLAFALSFAAVLHQFRREVQLTQERADATITTSAERGFALLLAWGTYMRGWALAEEGQRDEGIAQIQQGIAAYRATGAAIGRPYQLALLIEAYGKGGQAEEGLSLLAEALATMDDTDERWWEAELCRLKGQLTLQQSGVPSIQHPTPNPQAEAEAEACFLKAIEIAQQQQAKSLELRATMSLARLWQQQGKQKDAHHMLAEIYGWFTEGFDTKDLQEAKALLEELNH